MLEYKTELDTDIVLIGAGIMSATLGVLLKELQPGLTIDIFERLETVASESSDAWNNAGTGHSAFCELNYTPEDEAGNIDISKAIKIASSFERSKEFWSYLVENNKISASPEKFINQVPHVSFVWGDENVAFLRKRHEALSKIPLFKKMEYTEDRSVIEEWMPLVMKGRGADTPVAATKMNLGTDVNFGELTREMFAYLASMDGVTLHLHHEVRDLEKQEDGRWKVMVKDLESMTKSFFVSPFVFIGAGGGSLPLLEKSDIVEAEGYGGFPVSGQWLKCTNEEVIAQHHAKVYGKAAIGAPPMSVPHLDTRIIDGRRALLFGPYAGFSTKFLKEGSYWDLVNSLELDNLLPMMFAGFHNIPLTKYLIQQAMQSQEDRLEALKEYLPEAKLEDWVLEIAGQRVQVIKKDEEEGGVLEFGTEIVCATDGSIAALLGASPGASTSLSAMIDVLKKCFKDKMESREWSEQLEKMIPSINTSFKEDGVACEISRNRTSKILKCTVDL